MKVLRAIGGFFARIGRWIANTAWIQPLLIVGGIFAVIFSIPYIKSAIERAQVDTTDYDYEFYKSHSLSLDENGRAAKLLNYLTTKDYEKINEEFGKKFIFTFAKSDCPDCKAGVEGWKAIIADPAKYELDTSEGKDFKLYSIIVDETDSSDKTKYLAKELLRTPDGASFLEGINGKYGDNLTGYALYKNDTNNGTSIRNFVKTLTNVTEEESEGMQTPFTLMYDYDKVNQSNEYFNYNCITAVFLNYISLIPSGETANLATKTQTIRDIWNYSGIFDPHYLDNK